MPGIGEHKRQQNKRKREVLDQGPSKRAKSESSDDEDGLAQILLLENEIFESKKNYNNITTLIKILQANDELDNDPALAAISLCRIFTRLMASGDMTKKQETTEKEAIVVEWLRARYAEYKIALPRLLVQEERIASATLALCMRMLKAEGQLRRIGKEYHFPSAFLKDMVRALLRADSDSNTRKQFSETFVEEFDDIRFYTMEAIE